MQIFFILHFLQFGMLIEYLFEQFPDGEVNDQDIGELEVSIVPLKVPHLFQLFTLKLIDHLHSIYKKHSEVPDFQRFELFLHSLISYILY